MKSRWIYMVIIGGGALAFLAEYEPFTDAVREAVARVVDDVVSQVEYRAAIQRTLETIRGLPETKEAE